MNKQSILPPRVQKISIWLMAFIFLSSASLLFPITVMRGTIKEKGKDIAIEGVKVLIIFTENTTVHFELETDGKGFFYKSGLKHGIYQVSFEREGYVPIQMTTRLRLDQQMDLNMELEKMNAQATTSDSSQEILSDAQKAFTAGKYDDAIAKYSKVIETNPSLFLLYFNRAAAYEKKGEKDKAIADYLKSLELKPDFIMSLAVLGKVYAKDKNFEKAVEYYKKAFDLGIADIVALYNYGACLVNLGNNDEAKTVFEKLIHLDPNYSEAYYQLGIICIGLNENDKAKELLKKFLELDPQNANASVAKEILSSLD